MAPNWPTDKADEGDYSLLTKLYTLLNNPNENSLIMEKNVFTTSRVG